MAEADFDGELVLPITRLDDSWTDRWAAPARTAWQRPWALRRGVKRAGDILGAVLLSVVFSPIILLIVVTLSRTGPVFFRHTRVGLNGRTFRCYKFRSMVTDADQRLQALLDSAPELRAEWLATRKLRSDPRITRSGRFLRRTSLDELPQLWNVIKGDMSLVGPRPVVRDELRHYGRKLSTYLASKPGLTGLWQVSGRSETSYRRRVAMDVYYARRHSVVLDTLILLKTVRVVLLGRGAF